MKITFIIFLLLLTACQMPSPTKVHTVIKTDIELLKKNARAPIKLNDKVILIDVRRAFDYNILHLPNAINLSWEEFADHRGPFPGRLLDDKDRMAARLSRLGMTPETKVIVVGYGREGAGEEGRLAWTLYYLGVNDVQFANMNYFKARLTQKLAIAKQVAPVWKPKLRQATIASEKEMASDSLKVKWIDIRSKKETYNRPINNRALQINWKEFINYKGRIDLQLKSKLKKIGIRPKDRVIVVSEKGVRSGAVVMAMLAMGFENTAHVAGGVNEYFKLRGKK